MITVLHWSPLLVGLAAPLLVWLLSHLAAALVLAGTLLLPPEAPAEAPGA